MEYDGSSLIERESSSLKMPQVCCVTMCYHTGKNCKLKNFPSDPERALLWETNLCQARWERKPHHRMCECHFDSDQFETKREDGLRKLRPDAVPLHFPTHSVSKRHSCDTYKDIIELSSKCRKMEETGMKETPKSAVIPMSDSSSETPATAAEVGANIHDGSSITDHEESSSSNLLKALQLIPVHTDALQVSEKSLQTIKNERSELIFPDCERTAKLSASHLQVENKSVVMQEILSMKNKSTTEPNVQSGACSQQPDLSNISPSKTTEDSAKKDESSGNSPVLLAEVSNTEKLVPSDLMQSKSEQETFVLSELGLIKTSNLHSITNSLQKPNKSVQFNETRQESKTTLLIMQPQSVFQEKTKSLSHKNLTSSSNSDKGSSVVINPLTMSTVNLPQTITNKNCKNSVIRAIKLPCDMKAVTVSRKNTSLNGKGSKLVALAPKTDNIKEFLAHLNSVLDQPSHSSFAEQEVSKLITVSRELSNNRLVSGSKSQAQKRSSEVQMKAVKNKSAPSNRVVDSTLKANSLSTNRTTKEILPEADGTQLKLNQLASPQTETQQSRMQSMVKNKSPIALSSVSKNLQRKNSVTIKRQKHGTTNHIPSKFQKQQSGESQSVLTDSENSTFWLKQCISYLEESESDKPMPFEELEAALRLSESQSDNIQEYLRHLAESEKSLEMAVQEDLNEEKQKSDVECSQPQSKTRKSVTLSSQEDVQSSENKEVQRLKKKMSQMQDKIQKLEDQLHKKTERVKEMEEALKMFSPDQLRRLFFGSTEKWSDETISKAAELKAACGNSGYKYLVEQGWPLPSLSVLDNRIGRSKQYARRVQR